MSLTTRRDFLANSVAATASLIGGSALIGEETKKTKKKKRHLHLVDASMPIVDTHQHLWDLQRFQLAWMDDSSPLKRSFLPSDYAIATEGLGVTKTVYMEVDVVDSQRHAEAEYVIDLCERRETPMVAAVISGPVGTGDFATYFDRYKKNNHIKGVRRVLHADVTPPGFCLQPQFIKDMQFLGECGKSYDLCMRAAEIPDAVTLVDAAPQTRFIVDHCGNLPVGNKDPQVYESWKRGMSELAARGDRIVCKISGIVASAKKGEWTAEDLAPTIQTCVELFGKDRIMFGGDWPVCTLAASYAQWVEALCHVIRDWTPQDQQKLFHDNAVRFYGLS